MAAEDDADDEESEDADDPDQADAGDDEAEGLFEVLVTRLPPPVNDACVDAVSVSEDVNIPGTNVAATGIDESSVGVRQRKIFQVPWWRVSQRSVENSPSSGTFDSTAKPSGWSLT